MPELVNIYVYVYIGAELTDKALLRRRILNLNLFFSIIIGMMTSIQMF